MSLSSLKYLLFLAAAATAYFLLPKRLRAPFLLLASYAFYALWQPAFCLLLLAATAVSYGAALAFERRLLGRRRLWIALGAAYLFAALFLFKYLDFFANVLLALAGRSGSFHSGLLLPVGVSFYTFTAASYLFDVGAGKLEPEKNFVSYALYTAFFPSILSGPINRAGALLPQIRAPRDFSYTDMKRGLLRFAAGALKKLVLADTLGILVDGVYADVANAPGWLLALAAAAYSLQIYFDFAGYTDMALGSARILGYELAENFRAPYLARSIRDFWRRWHMSLTNWFRDYLYFPLGGSRRGRARTVLNILVVFAVSGLWHGADGSFIVWGLLNGLWQVAGLLLAPRRARLRAALGMRDDGALTVWLQRLGTFVLASVAWVFFRAPDTAAALSFLTRMAAHFAPGAEFSALHTYIGYRQLALCALGTALAALDSLRRERTGRGLLAGLEETSLPCWLTLALAAFAVALFGVYGPGFDAGSFVYFQF